MAIGNIDKDKLRYAKYFLLVLQRYIFHKPVLTRIHLPMLTAILGLHGTGVEIGVQWGVFSEIIIKFSTLSLVYSVAT